MVGTMLFVLLLSQNNSSRVADPHQPAEDQNLARKSLKPRAQKTQGNQGSNLENGDKWWSNSDSDWIRKSKKTQKKKRTKREEGGGKECRSFWGTISSPFFEHRIFMFGETLFFKGSNLGFSFNLCFGTHFVTKSHPKADQGDKRKRRKLERGKCGLDMAVAIQEALEVV